MNNIYQDELYNKDIKERFLSELRSTTKKNYELKLKRACKIEKRLGKDLYDFSLAEIEEVIYYLSPTKLNSAINYGSILRSYIDWACSHGLRKDKLNPLASIGGSKYFEKFVPQQTLIRDDALRLALSQIASDRDIAIIQGVFEGIMGRKYSELLNLKMKDIDIEHKIAHLKNMGAYGDIEERSIVISPFLVRALERANAETTYKSNLGAGSSKRDEAKLKESDYIIKSSKQDQVKSTLISQVVTKFAVKLNLPKLTPYDLRNSGMLYMAKNKYIEKKGKLDSSDINAICRHYNTTSKDGEIYFSTTYTRDFLNVETIKRIYSDEVE
ncbi:hypothetical protein IAQ67_16380 [Paenibacillus peoriae]|uniref:Integrase n=1 Tax=Paenibacillus peoriae TaxID=59893 RepID=A0A7H0Y308_9BACL|nr:hypothetical protein [Paenibacillus peoriae]QNR65466.1 hypothetical protein IAQ67_16380 [Paenibacillus peoriae]